MRYGSLETLLLRRDCRLSLHTCIVGWHKFSNPCVGRKKFERSRSVCIAKHSMHNTRKFTLVVEKKKKKKRNNCNLTLKHKNISPTFTGFPEWNSSRFRFFLLVFI